MASVLALLSGACSGDAPLPGATDEFDPSPDEERRPAADELDADRAPGQPPADEEDTDTAPSPCRRDGLETSEVVALAGADAGALAREVAARTHRCADVAVVARAGDDWGALLAVPVALAADAPLLVSAPGHDPSLADALADLAVTEVVAVGTDPSLPGDPPEVTILAAPAEGELPRHVGLALAVIDHLDVDGVAAFGADDLTAAAAAASRADADTALLPVPDDREQLAAVAQALPTTARLEVRGPSADRTRLAERLLGVGLDARAHSGPEWAPGAGTAWLVDPAEAGLVAVAATAAAARGELVAPVDPSDLRAGRSSLARLRDHAPSQVVLLGEVTPDESWQLPLVLDGPELPGGGFLLFEDRRVVALAGTALPADEGPEEASEQADGDGANRDGEGDAGADDAENDAGPAGEGEGRSDEEGRDEADVEVAAADGGRPAAPLGPDGVAGLEAALAPLDELAGAYADGEVDVLQAVEVAATIASPLPGPADDYSRRVAVDTLRPLVRRAAEEDVYVLLGLQPGRADVVTQAREYEQLLLEPHVGLAVDPAWRLDPGQLPGQAQGELAADELQALLDWLAATTRDAGLPQKLVVVRQVQAGMLPDRDTVEVPTDLAVVVQMDGHGPPAAKQETYEALTADAHDRWLWGWRQGPGDDPPTGPETVLELDPAPVLVSYR